MPATTKSDLLAVARGEFAKLERVIASVDAEQALLKDDEGASIKDVVAHRAHWIDLFFGWYKDGEAGKIVYFPAEGYRWNELKRYNAELRAVQAGLGWADACQHLSDRHRKLMEFLESKTHADLYGGAMKGANNDWTPGRWAEAAGPSHYRSAAKYIRARLKETKTR